MLLAAACGAASSVVAATFYARRQTRDAELADARASGMAAFAAGELSRAVPALSAYALVRPDDVDAAFALACAQMEIVTPGHDNLFEARSRLQQVLARRPDHLPAKRRLMQIYARTSLPREQLAFADEVLAAAPGDAEATGSRAVALGRLGRDADAVPAWEAVLRRAPGDVSSQLQWLDAMRRAGRPADQVVDAARASADAHPEDARFRLPLAVALREAGREAESGEMLLALAASPQPDAGFVVELVAALDRGRAFDVAERLLARSAAALDSATLSGALVERMWQDGRHAEVIATTDTLLAAGRADAGLLALRALSLAATGRRPEARAIVASLAGRSTERAALAWADALGVEFAPAPLAPAEQVRALRDALARSPDNGIVYAWLGRAFVRSGDLDAGARAFREAMRRVPSWPTPCVELSELCLAQGRLADAAAAAKAAHARSPDSFEVQAQIARTRLAELRVDPDAASEAELLASVAALATRVAGDREASAALAPVHVELLARAGRPDDALLAARRAAAEPARGARLAELYAAARRTRLAVTDVIIASAADAGTTDAGAGNRTRARGRGDSLGPPRGARLAPRDRGRALE